jgi:hypothetical protein
MKRNPWLIGCLAAIGGTLLLCIVLYAVCSIANSTTSSNTAYMLPEKAVYKDFCTVAKEYHDAYYINKVVAYKTYQGTPVIVTGVIDSVGNGRIDLSDFGDCQYVLRLYCGRIDQAELLKLRSGQTITMKGLFMRNVIGWGSNPDVDAGPTNQDMYNCILVNTSQ